MDGESNESSGIYTIIGMIFCVCLFLLPSYRNLNCGLVALTHLIPVVPGSISHGTKECFPQGGQGTQLGSAPSPGAALALGMWTVFKERRVVEGRHGKDRENILRYMFVTICLHQRMVLYVHYYLTKDMMSS